MVETPRGAEMGVGAWRAGYLSLYAEIGTHQVLSACLKSADITRAVDRFEVFRPADFLIHGGEQISEDLEPATKSRIADLEPSPEDHRSRVARDHEHA